MIAHPLAGPSRRFVAYLIDQVLVIFMVAMAFVLSLFLSQGSVAGVGPALVGVFVVTWGYGAFCEGVYNGQTVGKYAMGIRVVSEQGVPISGAQAVLRNLVGTVDGVIPFFYQTALAEHDPVTAVSATGRSGGRHDGCRRRAALRGAGSRGSTIPRSPRFCSGCPARIAAGSDLARVLSDYVEARGRFGPSRRAEMAEPLARPLRKRFGLSDRHSADSVLCAVYHRIFVGE